MTMIINIISAYPVLPQGVMNSSQLNMFMSSAIKQPHTYMIALAIMNMIIDASIFVERLDSFICIVLLNDWNPLNSRPMFRGSITKPIEMT